MRSFWIKYGRDVLFVGALVVTVLAYPYLLKLSCRECQEGWGAPYRMFTPLFSLFCLIRERRTIRASVGEPSVIGLLLLVPCLFLGWFGEQGEQLRFEIVGFLGTVLALVWTFYGVRTVRAVLFPVGMLVFCLYFAVWFLRGDRLSVLMGHVTVSLVRTCARVLGYFVFERGPLLTIPALGLTVDTAALEFGSVAFVPSLFFMAVYSYFVLPTNWLRLALAVLAVPFVVIGNTVLAFTGGYGASYLVLAVSVALAVPTGLLLRKAAVRCARS